MEWNEDVCLFKHVTALYILFLSLQYGSKLGNEQLLFLDSMFSHYYES